MTESHCSVPALAQYHNFTLWRLDPPLVAGKKPLKVATHGDVRIRHSLGRAAKGSKPAIPPNPAPPLTYEQAVAHLAWCREHGHCHDRAGEPGYAGIGFRPAGTGFACLDIDDCLIVGAGGKPDWSPTAHAMFTRFAGAGAELSTSGKGLHIWFRYAGEGPGRLGRDKSNLLELYSEGQFIALGTPIANTGDGSADLTAAMQQTVAEYWPPRASGPKAEGVDFQDLDDTERARVLVEIRSTLPHLDQSSYNAWVNNGMRIASLGDEGREIWHEFSELDAQYDYDSADYKWERMVPSRTGYQALFNEAAARGWRNPRSHDVRLEDAVAKFGASLMPAFPPLSDTAAPDAQPLSTGLPTLSLPAAAEGLIPATLERVEEELSKVGLIAWDNFKDRLCYREGGVWRPFRDTDYGRLRAAFGKAGFKPIGPEIIQSAVAMVGETFSFDSATQWAEALRHDGVPRVDMALTRYFGVADSPYARAVSRYLFTALAGRCLSPGCQADMALVLVGGQGLRKTSGVAALAPSIEAFAELDLSKKDDDLARAIRGKLVAELAELQGLSGRQMESIKAWVTRRHERWTPKYKEFETQFARRVVLIGTTNDQEILDDPTGERRWLPVDVTRVEVELIERDRDQLWAEGVALWRAGGVAWQEAQALAPEVHTKYKVHDEWSEMIAAWLAEEPSVVGAGFPGSEVQTGRPRAEDPFTLHDVATRALKIQADKLDPKTQKRIAKLLRGLNYKTSTVRRDGNVLRRWIHNLPLPSTVTPITPVTPKV